MMRDALTKYRENREEGEKVEPDGVLRSVGERGEREKRLICGSCEFVKRRAVSRRRGFTEAEVRLGSGWRLACVCHREREKIHSAEG